MSKVRINDLARELEVKSRSILDALIAVGVTESKTHSSSIEADEAEKVRGYFNNRSSRSGASKPNNTIASANRLFFLHLNARGCGQKRLSFVINMSISGSARGQMVAGISLDTAAL